MKNIFYFGERVKGFKIRVLNEREVRAGAGILFFFAMMSFMNAWLTGNFYYTRVFVILFIIDFVIRIFINPKYSPSLVIGRFVVRNQVPEYVGAPQKRFAWVMGLGLAGIMFFLTVLNNVMGPVNLLICLACLILLFSESVFGICMGCKVYNLFNREDAKLCPGGTCELKEKEEIQKINVLQVLVLILFIVCLMVVSSLGSIKRDKLLKKSTDNLNTSYGTISESGDDCQVPDWAIKMGHEEKWKLHHDCK